MFSAVILMIANTRTGKVISKEEILAKANEITNTNIEDGVALFLEKELLKNEC